MRSAPEAAGWLGWGHRIEMEDLWHMQGVHGESIFARHIPGDCFVELDCLHSTYGKMEHFQSVNAWSDFYSDIFNLGISGGYHRGIAGTIDASLGRSGDSIGNSTWNTSRRLSYAVMTSQRKCYSLIRDRHCAYNESNLQPAFVERARALPKGSPYDVVKMEAWLAAFIERFGTHLTLSSAHGARVQALTSTESNSESSHACMARSMCRRFGWTAPTEIVANATIDLGCRDTSGCNSSEYSSVSEHSTCVAVGGDSALQSQICQVNVPGETLQNWLNGGDFSSGSSAFSYSFMPIADFLTNVNFTEFHEAAITLEKAIEYSRCSMTGNPPLQEWTESGCQCARVCQNGGRLDHSTCTCECRGDEHHGWHGPTCEETYGTCQPGPGTGNRGAARRCSVNNVCASWTSGSTCRSTDVCCATSWGTRCCPFGNKCHCGMTSCSCVP